MTTRKTAGKKRRTIIEETIPDSVESGEGEPSEFDVSLESVEDADTLQDILSQFGETQLVLKILRQTPSGTEFCYQTDTLDEEFIQKNFGGGDYHVRIFINGKYRKTIKVKIASRVLENPGVSSIPNMGVDRHSEFLEKMVLALVSRQPAENTSPTPSITELTGALANLDSLRGKQETTMDLFLKGVEFAKEISGGGTEDWKSSLVKTARDLLPNFLESRNPPGGTMAQPINQNTPPNVEAMLRAGIVYLKKKAISGTDPNLIIDWICANAEEEQYQSLIRAVLSTDFAEFAKIDPEIGTEPFFAWFKPLYDGLRSAFTPPDTVELDTGGSVGNPVDTGNNGKPRKAGKP